MATGPVDIALGTPAPDFRLLATAGRTYALKDVAGGKGTVIVFICDHCPYVKAVIRPARRRRPRPPGQGEQASPPSARTTPQAIRRTLASRRWPEFAKRHDFAFPYLHDESQDIARAYGAALHPDDFFGFDRDLKLKYRGRLDEGRHDHHRLPARAANSSKPCAPSPRPASRGVSKSPSIGCSIKKWRAASG